MQIKYKYGDKVFLHKLKLPGTYLTLDDDLAWVEYADEIKMIKAKFNLSEISLYDENYKVNKLNKLNKLNKQIKVKYFDETLPKIERIAKGNWIDLRAAEDVELKQFEFKLIPLGIGMKLPDGYEANVVPRSSTFKNFGIIQTNFFGIIDSSYSGNSDQWFFPALAMRDTKINKGDRICQFRINEIMPDVEIVEVESLDELSRGGHGSTGII